MKTAVPSIAAATVMLITGCGITAIRESPIIQAVQRNGEIAYYRASIAGSANLAKADHRAGLYNAEALDALLFSMAKPGT